MSKERLEEIEKNLDPLGYGMGGHLISVNDINWLVGYAKEHVERVQELESFKKSVEYTVDSETLELIIDNQDSDRVLSFSETYDEKIYLLQKRVQELEDKLARIRFINNDYDKQNKCYREAIDKIKSRIPIKYEQEIELSAALIGITDEIEHLYKALKGEE